MKLSYFEGFVDVSSACPVFTILIPNYKTADITKLCLRLIHSYTDPALIEVVVIDNDSGDASTEYLRSLDWIRLIERKTDQDPSPPMSHAYALDHALVGVATPYVLSFHTDTLVRKKGWLDSCSPGSMPIPILPGSVHGNLRKNRFIGTSSKLWRLRCNRTSSHWWG